jgi:hypothetical protein
LKTTSTLFFIAICSLFFSNCKEKIKEPQLEYNQKANQLIQQLISEENCNCVLEIPKENLIEIEIQENPRVSNAKEYIKVLSLKNKRELDSVIKISEGFELDKNYIKVKNIKILKRDSTFSILCKDITFTTKTCKNGVLYFTKPIFNKNFDFAIINYGMSGLCCDVGRKFFEYKNSKWVRKINGK